MRLRSVFIICVIFWFAVVAIAAFAMSVYGADIDSEGEIAAAYREGRRDQCIEDAVSLVAQFVRPSQDNVNAIVEYCLEQSKRPRLEERARSQTPASPSLLPTVTPTPFVVPGSTL